MVDSGGNILITDSGNNRVQVFDSGGVFISKFGCLGSENGQFNTPKGIHISHYFQDVADSENLRVQIFTKDSYTFNKTVNLGFKPLYIITEKQYIIATDVESETIHVFDIKGKTKKFFKIDLTSLHYPKRNNCI